MEPAALKEFLKEVSVFNGLPDKPMSKVVELMKMSRHDAGTILFKEGDAAQDMFIILDGQVNIVKRSTKGEIERTLANMGRGEVFGEMALIDVQPRSASVEIIEDAELASLSIADLYALYKYDAEGYAFLVMNLARELSRRLRRADQIIVDFFVSVDDYLKGMVQ